MTSLLTLVKQTGGQRSTVPPERVLVTTHRGRSRGLWDLGKQIINDKMYILCFPFSAPASSQPSIWVLFPPDSLRFRSKPFTDLSRNKHVLFRPEICRWGSQTVCQCVCEYNSEGINHPPVTGECVSVCDSLNSKSFSSGVTVDILTSWWGLKPKRAPSYRNTQLVLPTHPSWGVEGSFSSAATLRPRQLTVLFTQKPKITAGKVKAS